MQSTQPPLTALLQAIADELERFADALSDTQWHAFVETEQRTVGQLIHHVAWAWNVESDAFRAIAGGVADSGWTQEWLDAQNADQARKSAALDRCHIMHDYRNARDRAIAFVTNLSPAELTRTGIHMPGEPERTVAEWIEACLVGHPREHLDGIRQWTRGNIGTRETGGNGK